MTRTRTLTALLTAALLIGPTMTTTAQAKWNWQGPCDGWRYGEHVTHDTPMPIIRTRMTRLITCVFNRYAPGNVSTALYVADRESNLWPWAWNRSSDCRGLFQHKGPFWLDRVKAYLWRGWYPAATSRWPNVTALNPHANAIAAAKMVAAGGWSPWGL